MRSPASTLSSLRPSYPPLYVADYKMKASQVELFKRGKDKNQRLRMKALKEPQNKFGIKRVVC